MAGRGGPAQPWQTGPPGGPPGQQGFPPRSGGPPSGGPPGPSGWPGAPGQQASIPGLGNVPQGGRGQPPPWNAGQQPGGFQGMQRPPFIGGAPQGAYHGGPPRPGMQMGQPGPRPGMFGPPAQQAFRPGGQAPPGQGPPGRPMGGLPQPPGMGPPQMQPPFMRPPQQQPQGPRGGPMQPSPSPGMQPGAAPQGAPGRPPAGGWTEHKAPDGRMYYYHAESKTSSWTRPPELMQSPQQQQASQPRPQAQQLQQAVAPQQLPVAPLQQQARPSLTPTAPAASPAAAKQEAPGAKPEAQCDWKEFTAPDGRKYYHNRKTKESKWHMPDELRDFQAAKAAAAASVQVVKLPNPSPSAASPQPAGANGVRSTPPSARDQTARPAVQLEVKTDPNAALPEPKKPVVYATKEEAKDAFKELLASVGTASNATWEATMRLIVNDPRYQAFKTIGEKKACFNEYLQQRAKEEKEEARTKAKQTRDAFFTLLELSPELKTGYRYSKAASLFDDEPRWKAITDNREREQLFNEHMKEREKKEKEARRAELKKKKAAFLSLLEANKSIKADAQWRKVQVKLEGEDEYEALDKFERLEVFQDHIRELEKKEKERKEKEKEEKRRVERKNRDAFKELLKAHREDGTIVPKMRWKEYHAVVEFEDALKAVEKNSSGSRPKELFEDVLEEVEEAFQKERALLKEAKLDLQPETSFTDFLAAVDGHEEGKLASISETHRRLFFEEEIGKLKEKAAKEEKRKRRIKDDFVALLKETRRLKHDTTWADAKTILEKDPEYKAVDPAVREQLFEEHIARLKEKKEKEREKEREREEKRPRKSDEEDKPRKDKKRHKKERHGEKEKGSDKKSRDKDRHSSKRRHNESDGEAQEGDEEKKSAKRHRRDKSRGKDKEGGDASPAKSATPPPQEEGGKEAPGSGGPPAQPEESSPKKESRDGGRASDSEEGQL